MIECKEVKGIMIFKDSANNCFIINYSDNNVRELTKRTYEFLNSCNNKDFIEASLAYLKS
jgi:hypothetical protein